jgi:flagellar protein FliS
MLFDGAIRFLEQARVGFSEDDPALSNQTIHNNLLRAQAIITELNLSLNIHQGGELALTLRRLYDYFDRRLTESNMRKTEDGIVEVSKRMTVLRDAWAEMLTQNNPGSAAPTGELATLCAVS